MQNKRSAIIVSVIALVVVGVVIALFVAKARDNDSSNKTATNGTSTMQNMGTGDTSQTPAETNTVAIKDFAFSPAVIKVKVGTTVTWTNKDSAAHTVTADSTSSESFDSGSMATGKTFTHTFKKAGTFSYKCTFHPDMTGKVEVTD